MKILHIDSCALGDSTSSRQYTAAAVALLAGNADEADNAIVLYRDLAASPLSHISGPLLQVMSNRWNTAIPMNAELRAEALLGASLLQEFMAADVAIIGAPMYNFSMPSTLKAWLDRLLHLYATTKHEQGSKPRVILLTSGCSNTGHANANEQMSHHEAQLRAAFHSMGIEQLEITRSSTAAQMSEELKAAA